jgi:hypothetical protein
LQITIANLCLTYYPTRMPKAPLWRKHDPRIKMH